MNSFGSNFIWELLAQICQTMPNFIKTGAIKGALYIKQTENLEEITDGKCRNSYTMHTFLTLFILLSGYLRYLMSIFLKNLNELRLHKV
jgi:uncharacterized membrane protein